MIAFFSILLFPVLYLLSKLMVLPGTEVNDVDSTSSRSAPTDVGTGFMAGITERGPALALVHSFGEFTKLFGQRIASSVLSDAAETFFKEGGARLYIARIVSTGANTAALMLRDAGGATVLDVYAKSAGSWGNSVTVQVQTTADDATIPAGSFRLRIVDTITDYVELSPVFANIDDAANWSTDGSTLVNIYGEIGGNDPAQLAATNLAAGSDDLAGITDATRTAALALFNRDLGPGQVAIPGATTNTLQVALLAHAVDNARVPILDGIDTTDDAALRSQADALRGQPGDRFSGLFAPWDVIPGLLRGTTRTVPPCARVMGNMARNDANGLSPNVPAAGAKGLAQYVIDVTATFTDDQRALLNDAGVNVSILKFSGVRTYGYRTLVDPVQFPARIFLNNARLRAAIKADLDAMAEEFQFSEVDGQGRLINKFKGQVVGVLAPYYAEGSLYGTTAQEAFSVNTGSQINTPQTIAAGEVHAQVALKMSPLEERTIIDVAQVAITEAVA